MTKKKIDKKRQKSLTITLTIYIIKSAHSINSILLNLFKRIKLAKKGNNNKRNSRKRGKSMLKKEERTKQETKYKNVQAKNKGITLIALVITIIVLLILAGVSINILIGENGLLTKSQDAANENTRGGARDKVATSVYASYNTDYNLDDLKLKINEDTLKTNIEKAGGKIISTGGFPVTVEMDGYQFTIDNKGNIDDITIVDGVKIPKGYIVSTNSKEDSVKEGLVIKDRNGNEYVWIEVPKTEEVYGKDRLNITSFSEEECNQIYEDLRIYSSEYSLFDKSSTNFEFTTLFISF